MTTITSGQKDAAHRHDVYGVVYAVAGTLRSVVSGIADAPFYWSSREMVSGGPVDGYTDGWEPYISLPQSINEELPLTLGQVPPLHLVNVLVRNLPFRHKESLLTAITDGDWEFEGTTATLYAAYIRKGQTAAEIPQGDWVAVRRNGQFSGPRDIGSDGFKLPLVSREVVRRQHVQVREITSGDFPNADPREYGKVLATCYGAPDSWIRARRTDAGRHGLTSESVVSGTRDFIWVSNDAGFDWSGIEGKQVYLHRGDKLMTVQSIGGGGDLTRFTLTFTSTIDFNIPNGAVVQERITSGYRFAALNQTQNSFDVLWEVAFEMLDGRIVPVSGGTFLNEAVADSNGKGPIGDAQGGIQGRFDIIVKDTVQPPALIPRLNLPSDSVSVVDQPDLTLTQQPDFATNQKIEGTKNNYPSGPGFAGAAFDGNSATGYSIPASGGGSKNSVTFTFPSVPGGNFDNGDTIRSTLHFISQGIFQVTDAAITQYIMLSSSAKGEYTIVLPSADPFNQSVRFIEQGSGGIVFEVWWEHDLQADINLTRTDDVLGNVSDVQIASTGEVGFEMEPIKAIVFRYDAAHGNDRFNALPYTTFIDLQERFLDEPDSALPSSDWLNTASYTEVLNTHLYEDETALHFVIDRLFTWPELEAQLALASRCYAYYGSAGHTLKYIESSGDMETVTPAAEFRLPGVPNPNAAQTMGSPLMERTALSELVNTVRVYFTRDWLKERSVDLEERFDNFTEASNAESVAVHGVKQDPDGAIEAWPIADGFNYFNSFSVDWQNWSGAQQAKNLAQFLADRAALGHTRFAFDTNGEVVGIERGDVVRVAFASFPGVYRNVICEVESVRVSPLDAHKYSVVCRSIGVPQKGLTSALYWTDLFTSEDDTWADKITSEYDRWNQYFRAED